MPIKSAQYGDINYRRFFEPFHLNDLVDQNKRDVADCDRRKGFHLPLIEDFSDVDMTRLSSQDISHYVMKIKNSDCIPASLASNLVACVASDVEAFMKLRLYGVYCELADLRSEEHFHVTSDVSDAVDWILVTTNTDIDGAAAVRAYFRDIERGDLSELG